MVLSPTLARIGRTIESRVAPPFYRRSQIVTLSDSAKRDLVTRIGHPADRVTVIPPGVDPRFSPGGSLSAVPLVIAVGRLVPVKRFDRFLEAMIELKGRNSDLQAMIVGEGYERPALEARIAIAECRALVDVARSAPRCPADRRLSTGVGAGLDVVARRVGHDDHGGGGLWHPCRGHPDSRSRGRHRRRRVRTCSSRRPRRWPRPSAPFSTTRCCVAGSARVPCGVPRT